MRRIGRVEQNTRMLNTKELAVFGNAGNVIGVVQVILDVFSPDTLWDPSAKKLSYSEDPTLKICY